MVSRRGQAIASALITLSLAVIFGYALGDFVFKFSKTSAVPEYKTNLLEAMQKAESMKILFKQERSYVLDRVLYYISSRGGFGLSLEKAKEIHPESPGFSEVTGDYAELSYACGQKSIEDRSSPEKSVPYYSVSLDPDSQYYSISCEEYAVGCEVFNEDGTECLRYGTTELCASRQEISCTDYPDFGFITGNLIELAGVYYQKPLNLEKSLEGEVDELKIGYDLIITGLSPLSDSFNALWDVSTKGGKVSFSYGQQNVGNEVKSVLTYAFDLLLSQEVKTQFSSLLQKAKNYVTNNEYITQVSEFLRDKQDFSNSILVGKGCVSGRCEWTIDGDNVYSPVKDVAFAKELLLRGEESAQTSRELSIKNVYCYYMNQVSGCDKTTCQIEGIEDACMTSCTDPYVDAQGCNTPETMCEQDCENIETHGSDSSFVCACDDWDLICDCDNDNFYDYGTDSTPDGRECAICPVEPKLLCVHTDWYPESISGALDGNMVEIIELIDDDAERSKYGEIFLGTMEEEDPCPKVEYDATRRECYFIENNERNVIRENVESCASMGYSLETKKCTFTSTKVKETISAYQPSPREPELDTVYYSTDSSFKNEYLYNSQMNVVATHYFEYTCATCASSLCTNAEAFGLMRSYGSDNYFFDEQGIDVFVHTDFIRCFEKPQGLWMQTSGCTPDLSGCNKGCAGDDGYQKGEINGQTVCYNCYGNYILEGDKCIAKGPDCPTGYFASTYDDNCYACSSGILEFRGDPLKAECDIYECPEGWTLTDTQCSKYIEPILVFSKDAREYEVWGWDKLTAEKRCSSENLNYYRDDNCCQFRYEKPTEQCTLENWNELFYSEGPYDSESPKKGWSYITDELPDEMKTTCGLVGNLCYSFHDHGIPNADGTYDLSCFTESIEKQTLYHINEEQKQGFEFQGNTVKLFDEGFSKIDVTVTGEPSFNTYNAGCTNCENGEQSDKNFVGSNEVINAILLGCVVVGDPCGCYSPNSIPSDINVNTQIGKMKFIQTCLSKFVWQIDKNVYTNMQNIDISWLNNYEQYLPFSDQNMGVSFEGDSCISNYDCDRNEEEKGLRSICSSVKGEEFTCNNCTIGSCIYSSIGDLSSCSASSERTTDVNGESYVCDKERGWQNLLEEEGTVCTTSGDCDERVTMQRFFQSICVGEYNANGICKSCTEYVHTGRKEKIVDLENYYMYCTEKNGNMQWVSKSADGDYCESDKRYCDPNGDEDGKLEGICNTIEDECKMCPGTDGLGWTLKIGGLTYTCNAQTGIKVNYAG